MSRQSRHQHSQSITNGFTPGGHIPVGYSYLDRAHSLVTPTRRKLPLGMDSPRMDNSMDLSIASVKPSQKFMTSSTSISTSSPSMLQHSESLSELSSSKRISFEQPQQPSTAVRRASLESLRDSPFQTSNDSLSSHYESILDLVQQLPKDPLRWTPSHTAIYLTHVLGLTPKPIVEDVTRYVRNARMGGRAFLRLNEKQLKEEGLNLKWRKLMCEAVKKLRKECLRGNLWNLEGYSGGEHQNNRQIDENEDLAAEEEQNVITKQVNTNSTGTLKRLRDKKAVRMMISSFENIGETSCSDNEEAFVALGGNLQKRDSMSSLRSVSSTYSSGSSNQIRSPIPPVHGEGYVLQRVASYSSLSDADTSIFHHHPQRREFTREQLQDWFGDLSESEVQALADELDAEDDQENRHQFNRSVSESSMNSESCSGESAPLTPPANTEGKEFNLTPIDANVVKAIVETPPIDEGWNNDLIVEAQVASTFNYIEPLHKDVLIDTLSEKDFNNLAVGPRPGASNGGKTNPYRESTYEEEDLEALGLDGNRNTFKFDTAKKVSKDGPANDSVRIRRTSEIDSPVTNIREMFSSQVVSNEETNVSHHSSRDSSADDTVPPMIPKNRTMGTFGRSALMSALRQQSEMEQQTEGNTKRAEDESEWGVTFSRKASRRNTLARADGASALLADSSSGVDQLKEGSVAARMSELFNPIPLSQANLEKHASESEDVKGKEEEEQVEEEETNEKDSSSLQDKILLPLTTLEPDDDGKGSLRKRSMVLVDRRKFEALAKRMGVLEDQLAEIESISLPPDSDLGSLSKKDLKQEQIRSALDKVFTIPPAPHHNEDEFQVDELPDDEQQDSNDPKWTLLKRFGVLPSYTNDLFNRFSHPSLDLALGLAAGVGFVLISEVFGRGGGRH